MVAMIKNKIIVPGLLLAVMSVVTAQAQEVTARIPELETNETYMTLMRNDARLRFKTDSLLGVVRQLRSELNRNAESRDSLAQVKGDSLLMVLTDAEGDVKLETVDFSYDPGKPIIEDLTFHAKPGSLTAIVGPTGAGKTTIINLLMRFYDVDDGAVLVDDQDIRTLTRDSLRKAYTMVLQDTWLFHGTIFDNIAYGKLGATMEEVVAAAKAARIHGYISRLPDGYNTVLSDNGTSISKGQKQLLTIARAMLLDANMLILDEATSNVDTRTEQKIQAAMRELMKDKTCFVIAHRLSTIQAADHILVLDKGKVVEQGTHDTLMAQKGFYYQLYQSQFDSVS